LASLCPSHLTHLTHLHAVTPWMDCGAVSNLCTLLPELQELWLSSTPVFFLRPTPEVGSSHQCPLLTRAYVDSNQNFMHDLCQVPFPASLRSLSIEWAAGPGMDVGWQHSVAKVSLCTRLPSLEHLLLHEKRSRLEWTRKVS
jgi:hypothetical protein